ncbi:MAG: hypothetical protein IKF90_00030 [Parasporobacterium sp.]|nr:hypothetical protein [Parasporobacterium sp.]
MVIITLVYVIATIAIWKSNKESADAAKEQTDVARQQMAEMERQFNEVQRPFLTVRFDIIRSGILCFVIENTGPVAAADVNFHLNNEFLENVEKLDGRINLRKVTESKMFLSPGQKIYVYMGGQPRFEKIATKKAIIDITYRDYKREYNEHEEIDIMQYGYLLLYNSPLEDVAQHLKGIRSDDKEFYKQLLKDIEIKTPITIMPEAENDEIKYRIYRIVCKNDGLDVDEIAEQAGISSEEVLECLHDLQDVNGFVKEVARLDKGDSEIKLYWKKS